MAGKRKAAARQRSASVSRGAAASTAEPNNAYRNGSVVASAASSAMAAEALNVHRLLSASSRDVHAVGAKLHHRTGGWGYWSAVMAMQLLLLIWLHWVHQMYRQWQHVMSV